MTDQPKRRGRPPKDRPQMAMKGPVITSEAYEAISRAVVSFVIEGAVPMARLRIKHTGLTSGLHVIQQAYAHPTGTQWRSLPVVGPDAPDWEDGA